MSARPPQVIVVAYGPVDLLRAALSSVAGLDVTIVDNGQSEEVAELAVAMSHTYLRPPRNVGFGAAVNLGIAAVGPGTDVLLLNPDARISLDDVSALQTALHRQPRTAAVAPALERPDGSTEPTCWPFPTPLLPWRGVVGLQGLRAGEEFFLSGAVLMLSGEALEAVGGFDERFFLYAEETDWQRRARLAGFSLLAETGIVALHEGAATSSDPRLRDRHFHGSAERYIRKWYGGPGWCLFRLGSLLAALRRAATTRSADERRRALRTASLYLRGPHPSVPGRGRE